MRVPLSWLREYVPVDMSVPKLAHRLTMAGLEVAAVDYIGKRPESETGGSGPKHTWKETEKKDRPQLDWEGIYVGEITEVKKHPHADNLVIATVDYGIGEAKTVTGAPNIKVGDKGVKVPVAEVGAKIVDPHSEGDITRVKEAEIRGISSHTVICSEKELGISQDHSGVLILDPALSKGQPLSEAIGDIVLEFDLTPNLGRCLSVIGVAREVAALTGKEIQIDEPDCVAEGPPIEDQVKISIEDPGLCSRYSAGLIKGVETKRSPFWLRYRLSLSGIRPVNNLVDITNYVMWEWGQPLHAFDYHQLVERADPPQIIVRAANRGETLTTLDGKVRDLTEDMLLITDTQGPIALAGIMGGQETEITEGTASILLESANFDQVNNRQTAQRLKIPSEATRRFSKGLPAELTIPALKRAAQLMRKIGGGTIASGVKDEYPVKQKKVAVSFDPDIVGDTLGIKVSEKRIIKILKLLDFKCEKLDGLIQSTAPWYRLDVEEPCDLIEEVARVIGYDNIPANLISEPVPSHYRNRELEIERKVKDLLIGWGINEVITYSLTNLESLSKLYPSSSFPHQNYIKVANPLTEERTLLRTTLLSNLLEATGLNLRYQDRVKIFEIGRVFFETDKDLLPEEPKRLAIAFSGKRASKSWTPNVTGDLDFFDLKGVLQALLESLGQRDYRFFPSEVPTFHPHRQAQIQVGDERIGTIGEVDQSVLDGFEIERRTCLAEIDFSKLLDRTKEVKRFTPLPRFPATTVDIAVVVDEEIPAAKIKKTIMEAGVEVLKSACLFDLYFGEQLSEGKKSLAYSLTFQAADRTLTDGETNNYVDRIGKQLKEELNAQIRGKGS